MAKDFFKNDINIGDNVAFMQKGYRNFLKGVVVKITEKTVLIEHKATNGLTGMSQTKQFHDQVIVNYKIWKN